MNFIWKMFVVFFDLKHGRLMCINFYGTKTFQYSVKYEPAVDEILRASTLPPPRPDQRNSENYVLGLHQW